MIENRPRSPSRLLAAAPWLFGLVLVGIYLGSEVAFLDGEMGFPLDDPWIHLQFARHLIQGDGLAYNPAGGWIPGSTAPLWTALIALAFLLPGGPLIWVKALGAASRGRACWQGSYSH